MRASNWIQQADQAMIRAAAGARAVAASTHTAIHIMILEQALSRRLVAAVVVR